MAKISEITRAIRAAAGPVIVFRQGFRGALNVQLQDQNQRPVSLAGHTLTWRGEWYHAIVTDDNLAGMTKDEDKAAINLDEKFVADPDQAANVGVGKFMVDGLAEWSDPIPANADSIPVLVVYVHDAVGGEVRPGVWCIGWRRGQALDGLNA